jgi:hypothetical protein
MKTSRRPLPDLWETNTFKIRKDGELIKIARGAAPVRLGTVRDYTASVGYDRFFRGPNARNRETRFSLDIKTEEDRDIKIEFNAIPDIGNSATDVRNKWLAAVLNIYHRRYPTAEGRRTRKSKRKSKSKRVRGRRRTIGRKKKRKTRRRKRRQSKKRS